MTKIAAESESPYFERGQRATLSDVRKAIAPTNTRDLVEDARLEGVCGHVNELLDGNLPSTKVAYHENEIRALGGGAILPCLPGNE